MYVPTLGGQVPRRGNGFSRWFGRMIMRVMGFRFEGSIPDIPKFVVIGAPHSSNWDFIVAMGALLAIGLRITILGKHTLCKGPLGPLMRWCGIIPVDRSAAHGVVGDCVAAIQSADRLAVGLAPEGSRTPGAYWKSGFWQIARQAGVPVLPAVLDYGNRVLRFNPVLEMTDDMVADMARLSAFYAGIRGARRTLPEAIATKETAAALLGTGSRA